MYRKTLFAASILLGLFKSGNAQQADSVRLHIDSALYILKEHSLYSKQVMWQNISKAVHKNAEHAQNKAQTFSALKIAFEALHDKHAVFYHYNDQFRIANDKLASRYSDSLKQEWKKGPQIIGKMLGKIAYLRIPYIGATKQTDIVNMAEKIYNQVTELNKNKPHGWILDLRLNAGGNIRPMMAGLSCFFGNGTLGYYIDREGKTQERSAILNGTFVIDDKVQAVLPYKQLDLSSAKIAVLVGPGTASSGEILAVNFQQRRGTALFGQKTAGLANSTEGFLLDDGNVYFLISVSKLGDRNGRFLPEYVTPNFSFAPKENFSDLTKDNATLYAEQWILNR